MFRDTQQELALMEKELLKDAPIPKVAKPHNLREPVVPRKKGTAARPQPKAAPKEQPAAPQPKKEAQPAPKAKEQPAPQPKREAQAAPVPKATEKPAPKAEAPAAPKVQQSPKEEFSFFADPDVDPQIPVAPPRQEPVVYRNYANNYGRGPASTAAPVQPKRAPVTQRETTRLPVFTQEELEQAQQAAKKPQKKPAKAKEKENNRDLMLIIWLLLAAIVCVAMYWGFRYFSL